MGGGGVIFGIFDRIIVNCRTLAVKYVPYLVENGRYNQYSK